MYRYLIAVLTTTLLFVTAAPAAAQSPLDDARARVDQKQSQRDEQQRELTEQRRQLDAETRRYEQARSDAFEADRELQRVQGQVEETQQQLKSLEDQVNAQAAAAITGSQLGVIDVMLGSDPDAMLGGLEIASIVAEEQSAAVQRTTELRTAYERDADRARERTAAKQEAAAQQERSLADIQEQLRSIEEQERTVTDELRQAEEEVGRLTTTTTAAAPTTRPSAPSGATPGGSAPAGSGAACPLEGPYTYIDSWGFARSGGRAHKGTDIMAALGKGAYAYDGGTVTRAGWISDTAGNGVMIRHPNGVETWSFHLQTVTVSTGQSVTRGQRLGTNGATGNATAGGEHIHFEYHVNGTPVNPYPYVRAACG